MATVDAPTIVKEKIDDDKNDQATSPFQLLPVRRVSETTDKDTPKLSHAQLQRRNLFQMTHIAIKNLIETGIKQRHQLDEKNESLTQFCVMFEHAMRHGLTPKRRVLFKIKSPSFLDFISKGLIDHATGKNCLETINAMPGLKTDIAKCRAWIRLSLMEKKLHEYFQCLIENVSLLEEFYEPHALMRNEEVNVISGLLICVGSIDCNLDLKSGDLEDAGIIDFSQYLINGNRNAVSEQELSSELQSQDKELSPEDDQRKIQSIIEQKVYAETLANKLQTQYNSSKEMMKDAELEKKELEQKLLEITQSTELLTESNALLNGRLSELQETHRTKINEAEENFCQSRLSFQEAMSTMENMYQSMKKQFESEMALRLEAESRLAECGGDSVQGEDVVVVNENKDLKIASLQNEIDKLKRELEIKGEDFEVKSSENPFFAADDSEDNKTRNGEDLKSIPEPYQLIQKQLQAENEELKKENTRLQQELQNKEASFKFLALKVEAQQNRSLENLDSISPSPNTKKRETLLAEDNTCQLCHAEFSIEKRKQKCRSCGNVFCMDCTSLKDNATGGRQIRVCKTCL